MAEYAPSPDAVAAEYFTTNVSIKLGSEHCEAEVTVPRSSVAAGAILPILQTFSGVLEAQARRRSSETANRSRAARAVAPVAASWCRSPRSRHVAWPRWPMSYPSRGHPSCIHRFSAVIERLREAGLLEVVPIWNVCPKTTSRPWPWRTSGWESPARFSSPNHVQSMLIDPSSAGSTWSPRRPRTAQQPTDEDIERVCAADASYPDPAHAR